MPKANKKCLVTKSLSEKPKKQLAIKPTVVLETPTMVAKHTKRGILIALLQRPEGATIQDLAEALGWQRHSVHGVISGVIKKQLGFQVAHVRELRGLVYRIAA